MQAPHGRLPLTRAHLFGPEGCAASDLLGSETLIGRHPECPARAAVRAHRAFLTAAFPIAAVACPAAAAAAPRSGGGGASSSSDNGGGGGDMGAMLPCAVGVGMRWADVRPHCALTPPGP